MPQNDYIGLSSAIFVIVLSLCVFYYWELFKIKRKLKNTKMLFHYPFVGLGHLFIGRNFFQVIIDFFNKYDQNHFLALGSNYLYCTKDIKEIEAILTDPNAVNKAFTYRFIADGVGDTLLVAPSEIWRPRRKCLAKCFNSGLLDTFVPIYYKKSNIMMSILRTKKDINLFKQMEKFTMDSFCASAVGLDLDIQLSKTDRLFNLLDSLQRMILERTVRPWEHTSWIFFNTPRGRKMERDFAEAKEHIYNIVKEKSKVRNEEKANGFETVPKQVTVVDRMMLLGEEGHLTEDGIVNEAFMMIAAAADTSAAAMSFTCGLLGLNQDIQEKVYQEVITTIGPDKEIEASDIKQLKYLERVINESMRIFPSTPVFARIVNDKLDIGTTVLQDKTNVLIYAFGVHRDAKYWPNPLKFDPDRFLPEEVAKRPTFAFLPFSAGPRNCIGLTYAYRIMKTNMANLIRNFHIETVQKSMEEINLISSITMKSDNLKCIFTPRSN